MRLLPSYNCSNLVYDDGCRGYWDGVGSFVKRNYRYQDMSNGVRLLVQELNRFLSATDVLVFGEYR
jgi:hypothetical protein